ncbi:MAG TPA: hypothetical protein VI750_04360 [Pyrinomonadaceae bacterium]|nr:hypothetical protein [Pyrinomonadaceae bacterium]
MRIVISNPGVSLPGTDGNAWKQGWPDRRQVIDWWARLDSNQGPKDYELDL